MKEKINSTILNVIISCGILSLIVISVYTFAVPEPVVQHYSIQIAQAVQILFGLISIFYAVFWTKKAYQLFMGQLLFFWGLLNALIIYVLPLSMLQLWPVFGIIAGIFLFISGFYKYHKIKMGYFIPAVVLFLMGIWYLLFSLKIIKISFKTVVGFAGPVFLLLIAFGLVAFFLIQQKHKELMITDDDEDVFSDEEAPFRRIDS